MAETKSVDKSKVDAKSVKATELNTRIVALLIQGKTQAEIGKAVGLSQSQVSNRLQREDMKELLEFGQKANISRIPRACEVVDNLLDDKDPAIQLKAAKITFTGTGLLPSHSQTTFIQNIYNEATQNIFSQDSLAMLKSWAYRDAPIEVEGKVIEESSKVDDNNDNSN